MARRHRGRRKAGESAAGRLLRAVHDNSLSLTFAALFLICLFGQLMSGAAFYAAEHGRPIGYADFLTDGTFLEGVFVNWQAATLQLACLIVFGIFLYQKGATHSRVPQRRRHGGRLLRLGTWARRHSLALVFIAMFLAFFILHAVFGWRDDNSQRALMHHPPLSLAAYIGSAKFWFSNFQTWEAEFFAIGTYLVLSIFLRAEGSPESKPVGARDHETGEANK